jgi:hypothetical protein
MLLESQEIKRVKHGKESNEITSNNAYDNDDVIPSQMSKPRFYLLNTLLCAKT